MKNIIISSSNKHKISEIVTTIKPLFDKIYSLSDFPDIGDIKEDGTSIVENSFIKSRVAFNHTKLPSMADDTVLEVDHLMGDPGIYTARYAGENATYEENMDKLLKNLKGVPWKERRARFKTVVTYVDGENDFFVEGCLEGKILESKQGKLGFGYDPIFYASAQSMSLGDMGLEQKNQISHRAVAIQKFADKIKRLMYA
ncbi:MAG: RdgB/HAM1 family non-canonical purine NTP pyrophosphatase [Candidatus Marinimicrobia bacterium]|jgi:XTP/dITP diphosphohydrolase|nr:RdgB/HAM1 family non-canonical purine NTP pyrophosphatase [Candidatus Neomarinimicrobiota bacterium]MDG2188679.1 RdgB/HAM1 family non-canonical purine NTP pyrophosphatase [Candidatus Neomarinimicrobiota bacterium]